MWQQQLGQYVIIREECIGQPFFRNGNHRSIMVCQYVTDEGKLYAAAGSPEIRLLSAIPLEGIAPDVLQKKVDPLVFKIGFAQAMKNKWVERGKQLVSRK